MKGFVVAHKATVTHVSPLRVKPFSGSVEVPAHRLTTYSPTVGDVVAYSTFDSGILVLGEWA